MGGCSNSRVSVLDEMRTAALLQKGVAEKVAATYGPVKREVERRLKKALDPNNILAPGRCGISL